MADIYAPEFTNETAAIAHLEQSRWADGVTCPHCGSVSVHRMAGKTQAGYFQCNDCRDKFTCRTGTVMERSHIPVHKWLLAIHLLSASKTALSAHQLHRMLGVTYKSAWFLAHRIRESIGDDNLETMAVHAGKPKNPAFRERPKKNAVLSLVERVGRVASSHVANITAQTVCP